MVGKSSGQQSIQSIAVTIGNDMVKVGRLGRLIV
jgi:hypothetical protein